MSKKDQKKQRHGSRSPGTDQYRPGRQAASKGAAANPKAPRKSPAARQKTAATPARSDDLWLFGHHAVIAALTNRERAVRRLLLTKRSFGQYGAEIGRITTIQPSLEAEIVTTEMLEDLLPDHCVHQGIALLTRPLPARDLTDCCRISGDESHLALILDQVTDPHNVGAIIRSATAFGARAIISPERHSPPESGALAKSASGALEILPWIRVTNLGRALDELAELGYWRLGLDGAADLSIREADFGRNIALVMGAEGKGLRQGTVRHCDALVKLPIQRSVESLNVSNAAAIALYQFSQL